MLRIEVEQRTVGLHRLLALAQVVQATSVFEAQSRFIRLLGDKLPDRTKVLDTRIWCSAYAHGRSKVISAVLNISGFHENDLTTIWTCPPKHKNYIVNCIGRSQACMSFAHCFGNVTAGAGRARRHRWPRVHRPGSRSWDPCSTNGAH